MYEVAGGFPLHRVTVVCEVLSGNGVSVQGSQCGMFFLIVCAYSMFILGIDEATANAGLHIDEVEFDDTCNVAPVFIIKSQVGALYFLRI